MKKSKSSRKPSRPSGSNTAYTQSRTLSLVYCVLLVGVIGLLVFAATNEQPFNHRLAWLFAGSSPGRGQRLPLLPCRSLRPIRCPSAGSQVSGKVDPHAQRRRRLGGKNQGRGKRGGRGCCRAGKRGAGLGRRDFRARSRGRNDSRAGKRKLNSPQVSYPMRG